MIPQAVAVVVVVAAAVMKSRTFIYNIIYICNNANEKINKNDMRILFVYVPTCKLMVIFFFFCMNSE